jgi:hypothetical protein
VGCGPLDLRGKSSCDCMSSPYMSIHVLTLPLSNFPSSSSSLSWSSSTTKPLPLRSPTFKLFGRAGRLGVALVHAFLLHMTALSQKVLTSTTLVPPLLAWWAQCFSRPFHCSRRAEGIQEAAPAQAAPARAVPHRLPPPRIVVWEQKQPHVRGSLPPCLPFTRW